MFITRATSSDWKIFFKSLHSILSYFCKLNTLTRQLIHFTTHVYVQIPQEDDCTRNNLIEMKNPFLAPILEPQPDLSTYAFLPKHYQHWKSVCNNNCALTVGVSVSLCFRPLQPRSESTKTRCRPSVSSCGRRTAPSSSSPPPTDRSTSSTRTASSSTPSSRKKFRPKTRSLRSEILTPESFSPTRG